MKNLLTSDLINTAIEMRSKAYAPYSNYKVCSYASKKKKSKRK